MANETPSKPTTGTTPVPAVQAQQAQAASAKVDPKIQAAPRIAQFSEDLAAKQSKK
jgi:hypothetical protein